MDNSNYIQISHVNIRQSIVILIARLTALDILLAAIIICFYYLLFYGEQLLGNFTLNTPIFLTSFGLVGFFKISASCYVVLKWLNEYYELTTEYVMHKSGIMFKKKEQFRIDHIRRIEVEDSFLGELFNFATIVLYDLRLNKFLSMYLIHNATRYAMVLRHIKPDIEMQEDRVWPMRIKEKEVDMQDELDAEKDSI